MDPKSVPKIDQKISQQKIDLPRVVLFKPYVFTSV